MKSYLYNPGSFVPLAQLLGKGRKSEIYYYLNDHLGTPQELVNGKGQIAWSAAYRAYGNLAVAFVESVPQPLRFQGQYFDAESGLHYNRYRYYSPETARFITPDPIGLAGGLNQTQYVPNPTGWVDPLGLASKDCDDPAKAVGNNQAGVKTGEPEIPQPMTSAQRQARINELAEANAKRRVMEYETQYGMHTIEKHGPEIPDAALKQRAIDGTNPTTGRTPTPPRANPSSQFRSWRVQLHAINDAMTRKARGLSQHTGLDQNKNPIVRGNSEGGGRGYKPNRTDPNNPTLNEKMDGYEVKFDKKNPDKPFTAFPTEKK